MEKRFWPILFGVASLDSLESETIHAAKRNLRLPFGLRNWPPSSIDDTYQGIDISLGQGPRASWWQILSGVIGKSVISIMEHNSSEHEEHTSAGLCSSPGWKTPSSPSFPTGTANPRLKARPLVLDLLTGVDGGHLVSVGYINWDWRGLQAEPEGGTSSPG
jgi:hypothetical protein